MPAAERTGDDPRARAARQPSVPEAPIDRRGLARGASSASTATGSSRCWSRSPTSRRPTRTRRIVPTGAATFVVEALAGPAPRAMLAIDYGSDRGSGGPAHGYASHRVVEDLLAAPGTTDITAGVDFGFLGEASTAQGLRAFRDGLPARRADRARASSTGCTPSSSASRTCSTPGAAPTRCARGAAEAARRCWPTPPGSGGSGGSCASTPDVAEPTFLRAARERHSAAEA